MGRSFIIKDNGSKFQDLEFSVNFAQLQTIFSALETLTHHHKPISFTDILPCHIKQIFSVEPVNVDCILIAGTVCLWLQIMKRKEKSLEKERFTDMKIISKLKMMCKFKL